jgi:protein-tyrosine phosphatase
LIDIHCHILPGVDDGPETLDDSIALAQEAVSNGMTTIIATPHHRNGVYINEKDTVVKQVDQLQLELDSRNIFLKILPSQEIRVYAELIDDLKNHQLLTLDEKYKYILLELPYDQVPINMNQLIYEIQLLGLIPIIPHPERNLQLREQPNLLYQMLKIGALSQLTAASMIGKFGKEVQKCSIQCIEHNLCHFIASDAHKAGKRGIYLKEAYDFITKKFGSGLSYQLKENAEKVVDGLDIYVDPPYKIERKKSLFGFLRRSGT